MLMKKILLSMLCLLSIVATANAQAQNLISNGDFEQWVDGKPTDWATLATSNATIEQSSDAQSGSSSVAVMGASSNKRIATKSYTLSAGTYTMSAYVKMNGEDAGHYRLGYVTINDGTAGNYVYSGDAATAAPAEWTKVNYEFTLDASTELALIVMNNKNGNGASFLLDNVTLTAGEGGGIEEGGEGEGGEESGDETAVSTIADIKAAGPGNAKAKGTIIATYARGFLLCDDTGAILVYLGSDKGHAVGDEVTVSGTTSVYGGLLQFGNSSTVEKTGTSVIELGTPTVMDGAALDAYLDAPEINYVEYTGTLTISGYYYNVNVEGAKTAVGSISYPKEGLVSDDLNGKVVKVTGFVIGTSSSKYVNTMAVKVEAVDGEEGGEGEGGEGEETPVETTTIREVIKAGAGEAKTEGTVVATYGRGFLISDGTGRILVYMGSDSGFTAGDVVTVSGTTSIYGGMLQFGSGTTAEKSGTATVEHPSVTVIEGADLDYYIEEPAIEYVEYTGTLTISGNYYNVAVEGAETAIGSIQYPQEGMVTAKSGDVVKVTGYIVGVSSNKYINTMATKVEVVEASEPEEVKEFTVTEALAAYVDGESIPAIVTGYIVGYINPEDYLPVFDTTGDTKTNLLIAASGEETDIKKCIPVQLPSGAIRNALNLIDNPENLKKEVKLTGSLETYFQTAGLKNITAYEFTGNTGIADVINDANGEKVIFDLTGRRINSISKPGIYIVNGKKRLVK